MYIVQINSNLASDGYYQRNFSSLDDSVREFIKSSAASLRRNSLTKEIKCMATILRNGSKLSEARVIDC